MNLTYHIHYLPAGQIGNEAGSITPTNANGGFASGPFVRKLWDEMINGLNRNGYMTHPDTGQELVFASLHYGGQVDKFGNASSGVMCKKWDKAGGLMNISEPEPELYSMAAKMRLANVDVPEQPPPPMPEPEEIFSNYGNDFGDEDIVSPETLNEL